MARRRRRPARQPRRRTYPLARLVLLLALAGIIIYGYSHRHQLARLAHPPTHRVRHIAVAEASPSPALTTPASVAPSAIPAPSGGAKVAIIIDDVGYNLERDRRFLSLPIPITLAVLPMTPHGREIAQDAVAAGKSVMLHLPMEPEVPGPHADPGPGEITTAMTDDQVQAQVQADIDALPPVPGANNHMGSKATSDERVMRDVLEVLKRDNLFFIDSMTNSRSVGIPIAQSLGVPTAARDVFLDNQVTVEYVEAQLRRTQADAMRRGAVIAIGHPNAATADALAALIPEMEAAGVVFVPAADLVR